MSNIHSVQVLDTHHWTDSLFSFKTTRDPAFRFESGQFVMLGLEIQKKLLLRAYSIASASYEDHLEFFSIKVDNGPLTSVLKSIRPGDSLFMGRKATGTLLIENLRPGRNLYLLGTGTGLAPFLSLVQDPCLYGRFEKIILAHGCRLSKDLAYSEFITQTLPMNPLIGETVRSQLLYYRAVTREPAPRQRRLTERVQSGQLADDLGLPPIDPRFDRFMLCGSTALLDDMRRILEERQFTEGNSSSPGDYVYEKAFVG
jgi:ferredoxin--NADP+ reductase